MIFATPSLPDGSQLRHTVEKLHGILAKRCDMEGELSHLPCSIQLAGVCTVIVYIYTEENSQLKERIASMQSAAEQLEEVQSAHCARSLKRFPFCTD